MNNNKNLAIVATASIPVGGSFDECSSFKIDIDSQLSYEETINGLQTIIDVVEHKLNKVYNEQD